MVPLANLSIKPGTTGEVALPKNHIVFHHLLYKLIDIESLLCSTAPINFIEMPFYSSRVSDSDGV